MKGRLTISRIHGGTEELPIRIRVVDESSMAAFIDVHLSLADFGAALTGMSDVGCEFELRPSLVGKIREHKYELVPIPPERFDRRLSEVAREALQPFEVDGWKGSVDDLFNHHRREGDCMRVGFTRYLDPEAS